MLSIIILVILLAVLSDVFFTADNLMNVLRQVSMTAIISAGMTMVMLTGEIDISLGSAVGFTNVLWAKLMVDYGFSPVPGAMICFLLVICFGLINGFLVAKVKVPPLIATFAMMSILRGMVYVLTDAYPVYNVPQVVLDFARDTVFGIVPIPVVIMAGVFAVAIFITSKTKFGRFIYAVGGNAEAAHISGIKVVNTKLYAFIICQCLTCLAAIILTGRIGAGQTTSGTGWEFEALIACVIGGVSFAGGKGKMLGALSGAVFVGILVNGMTLLRVNSYYQQIIKGVILVLALVLDVITTKNRKKL